MKPLRLEMQDFICYKHTVIDLEEITLAAIIGPNGAGKSTIPFAERVALFGRKADASLSDLIFPGSSRFVLTFDFEVDGNIYRVVREQGKEQTATLFRFVNGSFRPIAEAKVSDVDAKIEEIIGCGYSEFVMTSNIPQGELGAFPKIDPAKRREWLISNLPMGVYKDLEVAAKNTSKGLGDKLAGLEAVLGALSDVDQSDIEILISTQSQIEAGISGQREALALSEEYLRGARKANAAYDVAERDYQQAERDFQQALEDRKKHDAELDRASGALIDLRHQLAGMPPVTVTFDVDALHAEQAGLSGLTESSRRAQEAAADARKHLEAADDRRKAALYAVEREERARQDFDGLEVATCPTCGQNVDGEARTQARDDYSRRISEAMALVEELTEEVTLRMSGLAELDAEKQAAIEAAAEALPRKAEIAELLKAAEAARSVEVERARLVEREANGTRVVEDLEARAAELNEGWRAMCERVWHTRDAVGEMTREDTEGYEMSLAEIRGVISDLERQHERVLATIEQRRRDEERLSKAEAERESVLREMTLVDLLVKAYGKNGIPGRIINSAVADIETAANDFLGQFTSGLTLSIETQRENKGAGIKEVLDINVSDSRGTRRIERFSGGQRTRVYFALSVALAQFVANNRGVRVDSFVVDEPEYLDDDGLAELLDCLHVLGRSVSSVRLISHYKEASEALPQRIVVKVGSLGSTAEVVA